MHHLPTFVGSRFEQGSQPFGNGLARTEDARTHRTDRAFHDARDFLVAQTLELAQHDCCAQLLGQSRHGVFDRLADLLRHQQPFGRVERRIDDDPIEVDGLRVVASKLPAANVAVTSYVGPYDGMGQAWGDFMGQISAMGFAPGNPFWETYVTEPTPDTDPATLRTDLYCVVRLPDDAA